MHLSRKALEVAEKSLLTNGTVDDFKVNYFYLFMLQWIMLKLDITLFFYTHEKFYFWEFHLLYYIMIIDMYNNI